MELWRQPRIQVRRGLAAAIVAALVPGLLFLVAITLSLTIRWKLLQSNAFDRAYDVSIVKDRSPIIVLAFVTVFGCAGWATYAFSVTKYQYMRTLIILLVFSGPAWYLLFASPLNPRSFKSMHHPRLYGIEVLMITLPPLIACAVLTLKRIRDVVMSEKSSSVEKQQGDGKRDGESAGESRG